MGFFDRIINKKQPPQNIIQTNTPAKIKGVGNLTPQWINLNSKLDLYKAYCYTPPLFNIINYEASVFSRCKFIHYKKQTNGKLVEIPNSLLIKHLNNPNPLQNGREFLIQQYVYWQVFGNTMLYNLSLQPTNYEQIINLWNLPIQYLTIKLTNKYWACTKLNEIIESVKLSMTNEDFSVDNIIIMNDSTINWEDGRYVFGNSKINGLKQNISNIQANLKSRNILLNNRGAIGILSNKDRDDAGSTPIDPKYREQLQKDYADSYGFEDGKFQVIITEANVEWQAITVPVKDMLFGEQHLMDKKEIADGYMLPMPLLNEYESAAGQANMANFQKLLYENKIKPDWEILESTYNKFFQLEEKKEFLKVSFDHIEVLQKDRKSRAEIAAIESNIILNTQKSVKELNTTKESAINQISELLDYDYDKSKRLLDL